MMTATNNSKRKNQPNGEYRRRACRNQRTRDRQGTFSPILLPKHARQFSGFDDKIIAMYARGMSTRDISAFLEEQYGIGVSAEYVSTVTDRVLEDVDRANA